MNDVVAGSTVAPSALQQIGADLLLDKIEANELEALVKEHGEEKVAKMLADLYMEGFTQEIQNAINDSDLPQAIKDDLTTATMVNMAGGDPAAEAVRNSDAGAEASADGATAGREAVNAANSPEETQIVNDELVNEGHAPVTPAAGGGEAPAGGAEGEHVTTAEDVRDDAGKPEEEEDGPANWLVALARSLSKIQSGFLDTAMAASEVMANESANAGKDSEVFLTAQGEYTAHIQLFTIFSNQTSTSIKSIGEALAGISRKQ